MKKISKISTFVIVLVLGLSITFTFPIQVFAQVLPDTNNQSTGFDNLLSSSAEIGNIVSEITGERTETSKEFLLDDGTKLLAQYNQPVHYKDSKGKWVDYDNTLVNDKTSTADEASGDDYANQNSDISVKLSKKAKTNNMVKVTYDGYSISWGYDDVNKSKASVVKNNTKIAGNNKYTTLENITSETNYMDVYKNVDLQYFVTSTGVKENIILKSSDVQNEFNLTYKIKNLTAKQTNDSTITLFNKENKSVYTIEAPYMYDADGNTSTQLKIEIVSQKGSELKVKLTVDYWFLNSIGRQYPVTVDPQFTVKQSSQLSLGQAYASGYMINHGPYFNNNAQMITARANTLPTIENGEKIISAKYNFETTNGSTLFANENDAPIIVNAHKVQSINNNIITYDSTVLDYDSLTYSDNEYMSFDLTQLMNEWYDNGNAPDAFVLESLDTVGSRQVNFKMSTVSSITPSLTIIYKDFKGTESNLSYHTIPAGQDAQVAVADYLGNLIVSQELYTGTGARLPVSISATYNSVNYNELFDNGSPTGYGWQFSFNQYIRETNSTLKQYDYDYIYKDTDGTDHYLKLMNGETSKWEDEDGLGLTFTKDENNMYIISGSTTQTYQLPENGGKFLSEKDEHNNTITYGYNTDGNVSSITDAAGNVTSFSYVAASDGKKYINEITLPDAKKVIFSYTNNLLTKVKFADGKASVYTYNSDGRIVSVKQCDESTTPVTNGTSVELLYNNKGQIIKITEKGTDNSEGNHLNIQYNNDNTTVFTDSNGKSTTYTFDYAGNKISVLNANGYIEDLGSSNLSVSKGSDSFTKNYITQSTEQTAIGSGKYYEKIDGYKDNVCSSGGICEIDAKAATSKYGKVQYCDSTSIKINNPNSTSNSAFYTEATHKYSDISFFKGKALTFSAFVKTYHVNQIYLDGAVGAALKITCLDSNGASMKEVTSVGIEGTQDWQRISVTLTIPEEAATFRVSCMNRYASGIAWFDCLQLEESDCANDVNILQNSDFESGEHWLNEENNTITVQDNSTVIQGMPGAFIDSTIPAEEVTPTDPIQFETYCSTVTETVPNDIIYTYDNYGNQIKTEQGFVTRTVNKTYVDVPEDMTTAPTETNPSTEEPQNSVLDNKYIYQTVNIDRANIAFNFSGEVQAKSIPISNQNRTFGLALNIYYDGNDEPETHYKEFNPQTSARQSVVMTVTPSEENKNIDYVEVAFVYANNENAMTIYNSMLNVSHVATLNNNNSEQDPEENNNDTNTSGDNTVLEDYCINSDIISEEVDKNKLYMQNSSVYDNAGNYITSKTNEAGFTESYNYNESGNKTSVTDGENNVVNYTYNNSNLVSNISRGEAQNTYFYNSTGEISKITHNNFNYLFNYDIFNNLITAKVGNTTLVSHTYASGNGRLIKTTYANQDYLEYTYDDFGNIIKISGNDGVIAKCIYNKKGLISKTYDCSNGETTYYYYDFAGNLVNTYVQAAEGNLMNYVGSDSNGDKVEKTYAHGHLRTITSGKDENGGTFVKNDGVTVSQAIDDFNRITDVSTSLQNNGQFYYSDYQYENGNTENTTTKLIKSLTQSYGTDEIINFDYTYDGVGNITEIKQDGEVVAIYVYDELNQLVSSANKSTSQYIAYTYDNAGNITNVKEYALSTSGWYPTYLKSQKTYAYNDTNWKDKLTSFNGNAISYDAMGNPVSYRNGMSLNWKYGRELDTVTQNGKTTNYEYNANGIRTQKDDENYTTEYFYDSKNNLMALYTAGNTMYFYYDHDGNVTSCSLNNEKYFFVKNIQGDVMKIIDKNGQVKVSYVYDTWGKLLSISDGAGTSISKTDVFHIGNINPFRYRSYMYDTETGFYYLQSRYYDPETGRFLNADDTKYICGTGRVLSSNLFTYCENNPIMYSDPSGCSRFDIDITNVRPGLLNGWYDTMTAKFYLFGITHRVLKARYNITESMYVNTIMASKPFKDLFLVGKDGEKGIIFENMIHQHETFKFIETTLTFRHDILDLFLSIGSCNVQITIKKIGQHDSQFGNMRNYLISVLLWDYYDFADLTESNETEIVKFINNTAGFIPQNMGIVIPYYWDMKWNFIQTYVCHH